MKVCIIGAGVSGLYCLKVLIEQGIDVECLESKSDIGGIWNYSENPAIKSVYKSCRQNHYRETMAYPGFPISQDLPIYLNHEQYFEYLKSYVEQHQLVKKIHFNQSIVNISRLQGKWKVQNSEGECRFYSHLIMCNGNYQKPNMIELPGLFSGNIIHSSDYKTGHNQTNKNVLIVGMGNSAVQIASDLVGHARKIYVSCNDTSHIIPRFLFGRPAFSYYSRFISILPRFIQSRYMQALIYLNRGSLKQFSRYPPPKQGFLEGRLPVSSEFIEQVEMGDIDILPMIKKLNGHEIILKNDQHIQVDNIILCTGFSSNNDIFEECVDVEKNYKFVVSTQFDNLYFIGHVQPVGPVPPVIALQSHFVSDILTGKLMLPSRQQQIQHAHKVQEKLSNLYQNKARYNDRVAFRDYIKMLQTNS